MDTCRATSLRMGLLGIPSMDTSASRWLLSRENSCETSLAIMEPMPLCAWAGGR